MRRRWSLALLLLVLLLASAIVISTYAYRRAEAGRHASVSEPYRVALNEGDLDRVLSLVCDEVIAPIPDELVRAEFEADRASFGRNFSVGKTRGMPSSAYFTISTSDAGTIFTKVPVGYESATKCMAPRWDQLFGEVRGG